MSVQHPKTAFHLTRPQLATATTVLLDRGLPFAVEPRPNDTCELLVDAADPHTAKLVSAALHVAGRGVTPTLGKVRITVWRGVADVQFAAPGVEVEIEDQDATDLGDRDEHPGL